MKQHIIILPGWMHTSSHWQQVSEQLTAMSVPNTIIDIPGFGSTPSLNAAVTFAEVCEYVISKVSAIASEKDIVLVGHSFGGRLTVAIAPSLPNIKKLILIGSPNLYRPSFTTKVKALSSTLLSPIKPLLPESLKAAFRSNDYAAAKNSPMQQLISETITHDQANELSHIQHPTLLIWGKEDAAVPLKIAKEINSLMPNSNLEILADTGHDVHIDRSRLLAGKIYSYVTAP